ncbi:glucose-6-phosphate dehydrogenase assembly protein OpcA [Oscillatoria sp. FACHB-1406]|uniref:glucose-6-phosphate dehydrogenase assembly protein OpcA n=1 Tax=Oscillatoria sp. FACHB-1406 TaxID=2692846 RepID=UPI0016878A29|nr:glucose-6-phosphate dehydrogenase assembly protein OpcA [Oscillatoria sp. FACHB-1406]MBD2580604.1 glucose-6-phosphate dehydrogenase assembly protein OpcA [Oscillatoria sp. FACHB-1406]
MPATPLVSLQAPKDVSIDDIDRELREIWLMYSQGGDDGAIASRATTFSFLIYEPDGTQQLLAALGFYTGPVDAIAGPRTTAAIKAAQKAYGFEETGKATSQLLEKLQSEFAATKERNAMQFAPDGSGATVADAIASANPCRIVTLCPTVGEDEGVSAQVSAYCPINKRSSSNLVCCEYITLKGTAEALERIGGVISALLIPDLPKFIWWKATPAPDYPLFQRLTQSCDSLIVDSSTFNDTERDLQVLGELLSQGKAVADLNWRRISAWQELAAEAYDPPERRAGIWAVDRVTIDYEQGNPAQALMYLGWLASRLQWQPVSYTHEGGDYDIRRIQFIGQENQTVEAELAGIPTADWGDIPGDTISLKLASTNPKADAGTVLCSETTGCMRMEAGGGAQSYRIQQVTSLLDQKTEDLLAQQLRRWGREMLYEESMNVTYQILKLATLEE